MESWYALQTKPRREARVASLLVERGLSVFFPLLPPRPGRPTEPLFPAYLFVRCDLESLGIARLQWLPGLRRIVAFDGWPAVVPDEAIALIRAHLREIEAQGSLPGHRFKPGDEVVIKSGPLAGLRGVFQRPTGPAERVIILIRFLGHVNRAEVPVRLLGSAAEADDDRPLDRTWDRPLDRTRDRPLDRTRDRPLDGAWHPVRRRGTRGLGRTIHYRHTER